MLMIPALPLPARSLVSDQPDCADGANDEVDHEVGDMGGGAKIGDDKTGGGRWWAKYDLLPSDALVETSGPTSDEKVNAASAAAAERHILTLADACVETLDQMDNFAGGRREAALLAKPAFITLVRKFAAQFELLTAAVDPLQVENKEWRHLISDARVLAALDAGVERFNKLVRLQAAHRFLEEHPGFRAPSP